MKLFSNFLKRKDVLILLCLTVMFVALRIPGVTLPYHQDELKAQSLAIASADTPHPPLTEVIYSLTVKMFGSDRLRCMPLIFGLVNLFLLYLLVSYKFGKKAGLWSAVFFALVFYNVLASLMVDIDGQILPFFLLLSLISYFKWQAAEIRSSKIMWGAFLMLAIILGFLTKLSFIIVAGIIILDFLIGESEQMNRKKFMGYCLAAIGFLALMTVSLFSAKIIFPSYNLARTISHATDYFRIFERAYLQVLIQVVKAIIYASPLLIIPPFFISRTQFSRLRIFFLFLALGLIFYIILFDFSLSALDKYLEFIIVPLAVIGGVVLGGMFSSFNEDSDLAKINLWVVLGVIGAIIIVMALQFIPQTVPALYPKGEWINRIMHFRWNFVFPFTGGSGPVGFYISWLFIGVSWILSVLLAVLIIIKKRWRKSLLTVFLVLGFAYNLVFVEEYLFGKINGSYDVLLKKAIIFIKNNDDIKGVITYNGIGTYELDKIGKYQRRLYAIPKNEGVHRETLNNFHGHYLVIDIPHLDPSSMYAKYFASCQVVYSDGSKYISAKIYDCKDAINL